MAIPSDISGLSGWWKADSLALSNGAAVTSWADSSGLGFTATQGTGGVQPTYVTGVKNGLPSVRFDSGDSLAATVTLDAQPTMWFFVFKAGAPLTDRFLCDSGQGVIVHSNLNHFVVGTSQDFDTGVVHDGTVFDIVSATFNGAASNVYFNGGTANTGNPGTGSSGTALRIGSDGAGTRGFNGDILEIFRYTRELNAYERSAVHSYLADKYAITVADYAAVMGRYSPDAILAQTGLTGAVTAIQDDPDSPNGSWLVG